MAVSKRNISAEIVTDPKLRLLERLTKKCSKITGNHSVLVDGDERFLNKPADEIVWCPQTFDGFACWDKTPAGATATQSCPEFMLGFDHTRLGYKTCTENGTWFLHPKSQNVWSNYTTCIDYEDLGFRTVVNKFYVGGYAMSLLALIVALIIFFCFRSLRCNRTKIHMHLFTSFAINNILWIIWHVTVVTNPVVVGANPGWCQFLHIVTNYFMVTGYMWMFCEGLHLHIALVVVFAKDDLAMRCFWGIGWGLSFFIVMIYGIVRYNTPGATNRCWLEQSETFWIINVPVVLSLLASFVFLVNVVRVLVAKLRAESQQNTRVAIGKAVRATLLLIPLFGLHFILIPLRPRAKEPMEKSYQVFSSIITSLQGLCVSILFCFTNHEVRMTIKTYFRNRSQRNEDFDLPMTGN